MDGFETFARLRNPFENCGFGDRDRPGGEVGGDRVLGMDGERRVGDRMSGNLCRCGAHNGIIGAIAQTYAGGQPARFSSADTSEVAP